jgi:cobaltochelatase CobS
MHRQLHRTSQFREQQEIDMSKNIIGWGNGTAANTVPIKQLFGINAPDTVMVETMAAEPDTGIDQNYWFEPQLLKKLLRWIYGESSRRNIMLIGDAGVGKSSVIIEIAKRINVPVFQLACSGKTRFQHLVGSRELVDGATRWVDGPLPRAMREGGILLLDEVTRMDAGEQMNLASVLDGRSTLTIPDTGEVVNPHPRFRVAATGNSGGFGDESGAYIGEKASSFAFLDRFQKIRVHPMPEEVEKDILKKLSGLPDEIVNVMIRLANEIRKNFVSQGGGLSVTISPRSMQVWAREAAGYQKLGIKDPIWEALMDTVLNGAPEDNVRTIKELYDQWI